MPNFEPNAVIRGFQLTIVGTVRALGNPDLFKYNHFRQAVFAVAVGIAIQLIIQIPIIGVKFVLWILSWIIDLENATWDDSLVEGLNFISNSVLQVPFLLMTLMRYITPTLDEIFMESLKWVDATYVHKHKQDDPKNLRDMYYPNLSMYTAEDGTVRTPKAAGHAAFLMFLRRYGKRAGLLLGTYLFSLVPVVGPFVMPAASFYAFKSAVGTTPAAVIFGAGFILPKSYVVSFLHSYYASRSLMRELLEPYFSRVPFTHEQKKRWFADREGVLFGFAFAFTHVMKAPFVGVLLYGVAQASTAYLVTKITDPPPSPALKEGFAETQTTWKNKHDFLRLPLDNLDKLNVHEEEGKPKASETPSREFS
ncbi:transmembrane protein UsgS [Aspergillus saccharolyticus JOP 1030-1]|uniref:Transmembrane protein UsgS n=1 Tax=Aspergillus saccharolyticus JOP 1030-1 TaxID=1450539 RepID=A0A318ZQT2_9EURO|nr:transmembrane protein UsgS [Aspergillus saccharolyticus JOP 1030-1]PYH49005.1 transmembrane protein UsgS [Aspergillus saccharolyticus JOP 1030-1]